MNLHFKTCGRGEPLLILHGLFGSLDNWHSASVQFSEHFQVFALDQRNHGRSPHSQEMSYELMAEDLTEFMQTHGLGQAHLLGHSMGGKTAMEFALLHPEHVRKLVVVDIAPRAYEQHHQAILTALLKLELEQLQTRKQAEDALAADIPDLALRQFLLKNLVRDPDAGFRWRFGLNEINSNYPHLGEEITAKTPFDGPALFVRGESSDFVEDKDLPLIKRLFRQSLMQSVPAAGHLPHVENPAVFLPLVLDFLKK
jgi:esterase